MRLWNLGRTLAFAMVLVVGTSAFAQEGLGKNRNGPGNNNGGGSNPPNRDRNNPPNRDRGNENRGNENRGNQDRGNQDRGSQDRGGIGGGDPWVLGQRDRGNSNPRVSDRQSRSGVVRYGTTNNLRDQVGRVEGFRIEAPRYGVSLERQVLRSDNRSRIIYNGYRCGYVHYDSSWRDDYFWYPHYVFDPFRFDRFYVSPWYYYSNLPPYVNTSRVFISVGTTSFAFSTRWWDNDWRSDDWRNNDWRNDDWRDGDWRDNRDIRDAVEDLRDAFENGDRRSVGNLVPRRDRVAIYLEGRYQYSLNANDFYDLLMDAARNTRTRRYEIVSVRARRDEVYVRARHESTDAWGGSNVVYQTITLRYEGRDLVIREFGTDR